MDPLMRQIRMLKLKLYEASEEVKKQKSFGNGVEGALKDLKEQLRLSQEQSAARLKEREIELEKIIVKALMDKHEGEERNNLLNEEIAALKTALAKMTDSQKITEAKYRSLLDEIEKAAESISCNEIEDMNNGNNPQHLINALEFETQAYASGPSTSTSASVAQSEPLAIRDGAISSGSDDGGVLAEFLGMNGDEPNRSERVVAMGSRNLRMRISTADKQEKACSVCPQTAKVDRGMKRKAPDGEGERMKHGEDNTGGMRNGRFYCVCGLSYCSKEAVKMHIRFETTIGKLRCIFCNERFHFPCQLKKHFASIHKIIVDDDERRTYCQTCCEAFPSRIQYEAHCMEKHLFVSHPPANVLLERVID